MICTSRLSNLTDSSVPKLIVRIKNKLRDLSPTYIKTIYRKTKTLFFRSRDLIFRKSGTLNSKSVNINKKEPFISKAPFQVKTPLNLRPGEWVEVKSYDEILLTLDEKRKHKGLSFTPDMVIFCGKRFKVLKKVKVIRLETTGENRKMKQPTVILEGVNCNGDYWGGCDRACFCFWREVWLKRIILMVCLGIDIIETIFSFELYMVGMGIC